MVLSHSWFEVRFIEVYWKIHHPNTPEDYWILFWSRVYSPPGQYKSDLVKFCKSIFQLKICVGITFLKILFLCFLSKIALVGQKPVYLCGTFNKQMFCKLQSFEHFQKWILNNVIFCEFVSTHLFHLFMLIYLFQEN